MPKLATLRIRSRRGLASTFALAIAALASGCWGDDGGAPGRVSNVVDVGGSSTVYKISNVAREMYSKVNPKVEVIVGSNGTGGGFGKYLKNELDIVDASRAAKPDEELQANAQGIPWSRFLVGHDGIPIVVNAKNDWVKSITVSQLKRLFAADSNVKTWKDLNPAWPDRKIVLYTPDGDSGTYEFFKEAILGSKGVQRSDVQASSDDNFLVKGIAGDLDGLGYFGYAYFDANRTTLRAVPVSPNDDTPTPIEVNPATILSKAYTPLSRPLYIYVKKSSLNRSAVSMFVKYYLDNLDEIVKRARYVPPTEEEQALNRVELPAAAAKL